jgi:exopolyphosphatase/guanosine-5'-triphosphate,3'-diphosphate pyrophosphatase
MQVAAIDVGTNSIRTVIATVHSDGTFQVIDQLREMVRLGEGESPKSGLTPRAISDGLKALSKAQTLIEAHKVDQVIAVATSAVREAVNGGRFVELVLEQTGIDLRVISAEEEARLIYMGAREGIQVGDRRGLFVDIGGGSVEFIIGDQRTSYFVASVKLGALRLLNRFTISDPPRSRQIQAVQSYCAEVLGPTLERIRQVGFDMVICTSGTNLTLIDLALKARHRANVNPGSINNQAVTAAELSAVCNWLVKSTAAERRRLNDIQPGRLSSIVTGAALWRYLLPRLKAKEYTASEYALREGILIDFIQTHLPGIRQWEKYPNPRRRSVISLAQRCHWDEPHSRQTAVLSLALFDQLQSIHHLDARAREWLDYAALLHDIGYHINVKAHHRHSFYLIIHGDLLAFTQEEIRAVAAIARYHRKRRPEKDDIELAGQSVANRKTIAILAGILRIADALDRSHGRLVRQIRTTIHKNLIHLDIISRGDAELELWAAQRKSALLAETLRKKIELALDEVESPILHDAAGNAPGSTR